MKKPDVRYSLAGNGELVLFSALNQPTRDWLAARVGEEAMWAGDNVVFVPRRLAVNLALAMRDAGFVRQTLRLPVVIPESVQIGAMVALALAGIILVGAYLQFVLIALFIALGFYLMWTGG